MNPVMILRKPITTEKSLSGKGGHDAKRYTFEVDRRATKFQIKRVVQDQFGVTVTKVNTSVRKGKTRRQARSRTRIQIAPKKFAMVTLKVGQKINELEVSGSAGKE